uniref:Uncharacterized protein n=1 Tax=Rhizophora mucronata TaxID=61149 RepID=A0A2P2Q7W2_RHIMU
MSNDYCGAGTGSRKLLLSFCVTQFDSLQQAMYDVLAPVVLLTNNPQICYWNI